MTLATTIITLLLGTIACGDDDDGTVAEEPTTPEEPTTTEEPPDIDAAIANLQEVLRSNPTNIAQDVNFWGSANATELEVRLLASRLCTSSFDPQLTTAWLNAEVQARNWMLTGPANRILRLAGTPEYCPRGPTADEVATYSAAVSRYASPNGIVVPDEAAPSAAEKTVCDFLGHRVGGDAVTAVLEGIVAAASRNRVNTEEFMPLVVEIAGAYCEEWLPTARDALARFADQ
jgi:hypothetical protein